MNRGRAQRRPSAERGSRCRRGRAALLVVVDVAVAGKRARSRSLSTRFSSADATNCDFGGDEERKLHAMDPGVGRVSALRPSRSPFVSVGRSAVDFSRPVAKGIGMSAGAAARGRDSLRSVGARATESNASRRSYRILPGLMERRTNKPAAGAECAPQTTPDMAASPPPPQPPQNNEDIATAIGTTRMVDIRFPVDAAVGCAADAATAASQDGGGSS